MGFFSSLFGGSKQPEREHNRNYKLVTNAAAPALGSIGEASGFFSQLLNGDSSGFDRFKDTAGFNFLLDEGWGDITDKHAAKGLLRSGSTNDALIQYMTGLNKTMLNDYTNTLNAHAGIGLQAGTLATAVGQTKNSSKGKPGIGDVLLSAATAF